MLFSKSIPVIFPLVGLGLWLNAQDRVEPEPAAMPPGPEATPEPLPDPVRSLRAGPTETRYARFERRWAQGIDAGTRAALVGLGERLDHLLAARGALSIEAVRATRRRLRDELEALHAGLQPKLRAAMRRHGVTIYQLARRSAAEHS